MNISLHYPQPQLARDGGPTKKSRPCITFVLRLMGCAAISCAEIIPTEPARVMPGRDGGQVTGIPAVTPFLISLVLSFV